MSGPVKRKRSPAGRNANEELIHMAGATSDHDILRKPKKSTCASIMAVSVSLVKIIVFVGTVLVLLSMLVSVRREKALLEAEVQKLAASSEEVESKYSRYESDIKRLDSIKTELAQNLGEMKGELKSKQGEVDSAVNKHRAVSDENDQNKQRLDELAAERNQLEEKKNSQINQLIADLENFKGQTQDLGASLENERNRVNQLNADLQASRATEEHLRASAQGAADAQAVSNENLRLKEQVAQLSQQVNDHAGNVNAKHQQVVNLENERNTIAVERNSLSEQLQAKDNHIKQLQDSVAALEGEKQGLLARIPAN